MKNIFMSLLAFFAITLTACGGEDPTPIPTPPPPSEPSEPSDLIERVVGADISWYTEMEADGRHFYNAQGEQMSCPELMRQLGVRAVRLRVWVNPENAACQFNNTADVVAKAKAAAAAKLNVMIDFHYSDLWADPSRQQKPKAWEGLSFDQLLQKVAEHTREVLTAVKVAGVTPRWVQIGNETRNGMIYPDGALYDSNWKALPDGWKKFTQLYMAGYNAAKEVLPNAQVMPHLNTASKQSDNLWWLEQFKAQGAKFDMVAFSHYPQVDDSSKQPTELNTLAAQCMKQVRQKYNVPVMVAEFGVRSTANEALAASITKDFVTKACSAGVGILFYWEPEVYGDWRPKSYTTFFDNWPVYDMGAFSANGRPTSVLEEWSK